MRDAPLTRFPGEHRRRVESFRANTVDAASAYVAISRARKGAAIYTDSRANLTEALGLRDGTQVGAIDQEPLKQSMPVLDL